MRRSTVTVVASLDDVAMMREPVKQRCGHLRIAEYACPLGEAQIGRDDQARALVELADQVEQ